MEAMATEVMSRLAQVRHGHQELRKELRGSSGALEALELREEVAGIRALAARVRHACREEFPLEEALAAEVLGETAAPVMLLLAGRRDLCERLDRVERLLAAPDARDDLWREAAGLFKALSCHLCRAENGVLAAVDLVQVGTFTLPPPRACRH
jgi:hypothetical protein